MKIKSIVLLFCYTLLSLNLIAQWTNNGASITTFDKIGVGTNSPVMELQVQSTGASNARIGISAVGSGQAIFYLDASNGDYSGADYGFLKQEDDLDLVLGAGGNQNANLILWPDDGNGNVGIGITNPVEKFQIGSKWTFHDGGHKIISYNNYYNAGNYRIAADEVSLMRFTDNGDIRFDHAPYGGAGLQVTGFVTSLTLKNNGKVGIGTTNPDELLTVKGKIHSEEIIVDLSVPGPDYVFEEDYDLPTLSEIEAFIKVNKHLPEVPSAKEMKEEGIVLGEMNMLLLKKIEELTLHTIKQQKEIDQLKQNIKQRD